MVLGIARYFLGQPRSQQSITTQLIEFSKFNVCISEWPLKCWSYVSKEEKKFPCRDMCRSLWLCNSVLNCGLKNTPSS